jgi:hypothetical protein
VGKYIAKHMQNRKADFGESYQSFRFYVTRGRSTTTMAKLVYNGRVKKWVLLIVAGAIGLARPAVVTGQTNQDALPGANSTETGLKRTLFDKPIFGTQPVLTLSGDYVPTPKEDYEMFGVWEQPLTLDQIHGVVAKVAFGEARKQGEWQLAYTHKLMTMDRSWQAVADANPGLTLSDRRVQVIKASYNLRNWWQLGLAAVVEDKLGTETGPDLIPLGLGSGRSLGFQVDTSLKF